MNISGRGAMQPLQPMKTPQRVQTPVQTEKAETAQAPPKKAEAPATRAADQAVQTEEDQAELLDQIENDDLDMGIPEAAEEETGLEEEPMDELDAEAEDLGVEVEGDDMEAEELEGDAEIEELEDFEESEEIDEEEDEGEDDEGDEGREGPEWEREEDEEDEDQTTPS